MHFNLLFIVGLNNKAPKKLQHHISVSGMYITDNTLITLSNWPLNSLCVVTSTF